MLTPTLSHRSGGELGPGVPATVRGNEWAYESALMFLSRSLATAYLRRLTCQRTMSVSGDFLVERAGVEPATSGLQSRRSPS